MNTENNKIVAEFIGLETGKQLGYDRFINDWFDNKGTFNGQRNEKLLFDTDWNWLMEVVEKIESLESAFSIDGNKCYVLSNDFCNAQKEVTKIKSVYKVCLEFIKWHNEQNK